MTTINQKIRDAIKVECDRQHVDEDRQQMLYEAYSIWYQNHPYGALTEARLRYMAEHIEPSNNGVYRTTPVNFNGIVGGVPPENIERAMENWIEFFNDVNVENLSGEYDETDQLHTVDIVIKEFLDIHPFSDGNGRTAWLLRVWMLNQWDDPQPLPDYYKEM